MSPQNKRTVFHIQNSNFSTVQGSTEGYYLSQFFAEKANVHIFAPLDEPIEGAANHLVPVEGLVGVVLLNILYLPYWVYQFVSERPDIVYCYENVITPAILARRIFGAHVVFDLRSDPYSQADEFIDENDRSAFFKAFLRIGRHAHKIALKEAHDVFVVSHLLRESVSADYGLDKGRIHLLPLGVDTERFVELNEHYEKVGITYIGAVNGFRGIETLLEAVSGFPEETRSNIRIDIYGDGPEDYTTELVERSRELPFELHWHGKIPHEDIPAQVGKSDIAVSPLPPHGSFQVSSPAKVFEYLAMGQPVVASQIEPHERILDEGENALLHNPQSAEDLRNQLEKLIENESMRQEFSENARSLAQEYSWEQRFRVVNNVLQLTADSN